MITHLAIVERIAIGAALGGVIGYERDRHGRPAGLRTHTVVALTAATFMVVSAHFAQWQTYGANERADVDISRIAASVVSGIGFLAGGAILRTGVGVQGLTTAAGLWLVTAIGMCSGAGMFVIAGAVTAIGLTSLVVLRRFEDKRDDVVRRRLHLVLGETSDATQVVHRALAALGVTILSMTYERRFEEKARTSLTLDVSIPVTLSMDRLASALEALPSLRRLQIEHGS